MKGDKVECPKCGKLIDHRGIKVHATFCKGKDGESMTEEMKDDKVAEIATVPEPVKAVKKFATETDIKKAIAHAEYRENEEEPEMEDDGEGEEEEESNPLLMICITVIAVAIVLGFFIFGRRPT